ncbi:hypothetical protein Emin_0951 [Elusimicrobium minutum Pei191]|uniref:Uncharacterized protein n=1 Tax=Elusimicrobium minutum (strain Pei191) TaxID=445932 RepID=B2KDA8_ELUMP|nr:hypothetical protein [Elusimicrobium minutum]ACC98504.1 hypothetical protein Emin_0951 [Elusimicrobium minutum Pei191]
MEIIVTAKINKRSIEGHVFTRQEKEVDADQKLLKILTSDPYLMVKAKVNKEDIVSVEEVNEVPADASVVESVEITEPEETTAEETIAPAETTEDTHAAEPVSGLALLEEKYANLKDKRSAKAKDLKKQIEVLKEQAGK